MKEVKTSLEQLQQRRTVILNTNKALGVSRKATAARVKTEVDEFLVDAWKRTRKGARNIHFNYGFGATTNNTVSLTGVTVNGLGVSTPFSGVLGGESMKTDSSDLGVEYYFRDNWAVEVGAIFSNAVREDESVDFGTLSYDAEKYVGSFAGVKYSFETVNESGGGGLNGRTRLFLNARLGLMQEYDISGKVSHLAGGPPVDLSSSGDAYLTLGLGAGVLYAWTDHIALELGVNVVNSITDMEGEWSFSGTTPTGGSYSGDYSTDLSLTRAYLGILVGF
jgi:hypothetical protein